MDTALWNDFDFAPARGSYGVRPISGPNENLPEHAGMRGKAVGYDLRGRASRRLGGLDTHPVGRIPWIQAGGCLSAGL